RKALVPATAVRRPDGVGNRRPTWIGTGGRHQSECPADIVGLVGKNEVDRFDPASDKRFKNQLRSSKRNRARAISGSLCASRAPGNYRVNFRDGNETTAYYTDNLEDALNNAVEMACNRQSCRTAC